MPPIASGGPLAHSLGSLALIAGVSFGVAALLTPVVAWFAVAWGWLDQPDGRRKLHRAPVPAVGGIAVFTAFAVAAATLEMLARQRGSLRDSFVVVWGPLVVAGFIAMAAGLADDTRGLRPAAKLALQSLAALYLFYSGFRVETITNPLGGRVELGVLALPVTVLWLVGMSNAFNLIDGLDGLAAGLALVSTVGLLGTAVFTGRWDTALVAGALAGALAGFLPYNFNPARVFLGDSGSLPVGLIIAGIAVRSSIKASAAIAVAVPLLALALPILDVGLAVIRRFVRRRPVFQGDHDHIHHRLVDMGLTPRRAVVTLYAVASLFTALALATAMGPQQVGWAAGAIVLVVVYVGVRALGYWEVTELQRSFLTRLMSGLRPSGDAALRGLEHELDRASRFEDAWGHTCEVAWQLGFTELELVPRDDFAAACPRLRGVAPEAARLAAATLTGVPGGLQAGAVELAPVAVATWRIEVAACGAVAADVHACRPLAATDFDPARFAAILQQLVAGHVERLVARARELEGAA